MAELPTGSEPADRRDVVEFLGLLTALAVGVVAITRTTDIVTVGQVYMFTPAVAGLMV